MRFLENRKIFIIILIVLSLFILRKSYVYYLKPPPIKIAIDTWGGFAPVIFAQVLGLYEKEGLDVEIIKVNGSIEGVHMLLNDQVEGTSSVFTDVVLHRSNGFPIKVLLCADYSDNDAIVALPNIQKVSELKGKIIGIEGLNSFSHVFVLQILEKFNLSEREVFFKVVPFEKITEYLIDRKIDAAHAWDPELQKALENGFNSIATARELPGAVIDTMAFNENFLKAHPDFAKKFVDIFYEAQKKMLEDPLSAAHQMKYFFKNDPDRFAKSFKDLHFINREENFRRLNANSSDSFYSLAKKLNTFYLNRGQTSNAEIQEDVFYKGLQE